MRCIIRLLSTPTSRPASLRYKYRPSRSVSTIVEIAGLPGSGKTTLANLVAPRLLLEGVPFQETAPLIYRRRARGYRLLFQIWLHLRHASLAASAYRLALGCRRSLPRCVRIIPALLVDHERARHACSQLRGREVALLDQGVLQQLRSMVALLPPGDNRHMVRQLLTRIQKPYRLGAANWIVISLATSPEVANTRIQARPVKEGRFDHMQATARLACYKLEQSAQQCILSEIQAPVISLDAHEPEEVLASKATAAILFELERSTISE